MLLEVAKTKSLLILNDGGGRSRWTDEAAVEAVVFFLYEPKPLLALEFRSAARYWHVII